LYCDTFQEDGPWDGLEKLNLEEVPVVLGHRKTLNACGELI
jgi:hypothetical protein